MRNGGKGSKSEAGLMPLRNRSVHDQVSRSGLGYNPSCVRRRVISSQNFTKNFTKLRAERAPKRPLYSAYSVDNTRNPRATGRLLAEGL